MASAFEKIKSERNKDLIVTDNHKFSFQKVYKDGNKRWCCTVNTCKSFIKTNPSETEILSRTLVCAHALDSERKIRNSVKRKAENDFTDRPWKLLHDELNEEDCGILTKDDVISIQKGIYGARRGNHSALPQSVVDVQLCE
ncbi:unnamed protein product [Bemisia tabaci]|uniref:FLYWCH-type domain-containing protein n=1 Tax=Bemisia tabaci TaxID=7038 RepID=A0A9P0EW82_BEMTA|nr:unnamed protein product [Bemisia tabaci]